MQKNLAKPAWQTLKQLGQMADRQKAPELDFSSARFDGSDYIPVFDDTRLRGQIRRVYDLMKDGKFRTLSEIERITGDPQASISAQLRHLRKERFGGHEVNKRPRGSRFNGLFEYQLIFAK